jgi:hypothetical protein
MIFARVSILHPSQENAVRRQTDPSAWDARSRRNETVLTCYQQADAVTMQRALDTRQRLEA